MQTTQKPTNKEVAQRSGQVGAAEIKKVPTGIAMAIATTLGVNEFMK